MKRLLLSFFVAIAMPLLSGCSPLFLATSITDDIVNATRSQQEKDRMARWSSGEYVASADIATPLAAALGNKKIWFAPPESIEVPRGGIMCRLAGRITPPRGLSYAEQLQAGLAAEARLAGVYDENPSESTRVLKIKLTGVAFSSEKGFWTMSADISGNGKTISVAKIHPYKEKPGMLLTSGSYWCNMTKDELLPAVQDLIAAIYSDPGFQGLVE